MATDNSPPQIRVILTIAFSSVVILGALNFVFQSYFQMMTEEAERTHQRPAAELLQLREGEARNLASGPMPIANAMKALAGTRDRAGVAAMKDIEPEPSTDTGALIGWIQAPNQAMVDALSAAADDDAGAVQAPGSAGAGDGGPAAAASGDRDGGSASLKASSEAGPGPKMPAAPSPDGGAPKGAAVPKH